MINLTNGDVNPPFPVQSWFDYIEEAGLCKGDKFSLEAVYPIEVAVVHFEVDNTIIRLASPVFPN